MKNTFITEAETINVCAKFIIRDTAQQQVGQHREKWFVKTEARQRCTPGEKGRGLTPREEQHSKEPLMSLI